MIEKLIDKSKEEIETHISQWGRYNDSLPNLVELTTEEFVQSGFFIWSVTGMESRQIDPVQLNKAKLIGKPFKNLTSARIFFVSSPNENGFVMIHDYWDGTVRYFKFSKCEHEYVEVTGKNGKPVWNCYHYYKCKKCGIEHEVDSSG